VTALLEARGLVKRFGGLRATDGVSLAIEPGEVRCVIGPNGAGKTTLFNLLTGHLRPDEGEILLDGERIDVLPLHEIARRGLVRKYQVPSVLPDVSVSENIRLAAAGRRRLSDLLRERADDRDRAEATLEELALDGLADRIAGQLSHGELQRLEIAMVLAAQPRVLLLDEPTAGMTVEETGRVATMLRAIAERRGLTLVIVEHDIAFIKMLGDRITVLHEGRVLAEGPHAEIEADPLVRRVYLGEGL
jgi:ABC-type branched-subunit amino acid transport system ATPase component